MSRFYGSIDAPGRKPITRCGHGTQGIEAHIRGWNVGALVDCVAVGKEDSIHVYATGGSNDPLVTQHIATITLQGGRVNVEQHPNKKSS